MADVKALEREAAGTSMEYDGELFAEAVSRFYYHNLPPELGQELGSLILRSFSAEEDKLGESPRVIAAGIWKMKFIFQPPAAGVTAKLFNHKWSPDYPGVRNNPLEVFNNIASTGLAVLEIPEETEEFEQWLDEINSTEY